MAQIPQAAAADCDGTTGPVLWVIDRLEKVTTVQQFNISSNIFFVCNHRTTVSRDFVFPYTPSFPYLPKTDGHSR